MKPKAVVLLSGGLDSSTVLAVAKRDGFVCYPLLFRYGQRHERELDAARVQCAVQGTEAPLVMDVSMRNIGGSALTDAISVPQRAVIDDSIPVTYVPARNLIFLSFAAAYAETLGSGSIFIGVNALDYSGYPDCRPEFLAAFVTAARLGTKAGVEGSSLTVHAPLIHKTKAEIIQLGIGLGVDYSKTHSCYDPIAEYACGACDSCQLRQKGFSEAGFVDPVLYAKVGA